jgi:CspA family cold shock protein
MPIGTVKFFNEHKGYGFIQPDDGGKDAFVHISAVERSGFRSLRQDQRISYDLQQDQRGKTSAVNLKSADDAGAPEASADDAAAPEASAEEADEEASSPAANDQAE